MGWLKEDSGVSALNEDGGMVGILDDYIRFATDCLDNQTLEFELTGYDSQTELIQALKDDQIDMIFHFAQIPYAAEVNGFALSNTVWSDNMAAVTTQTLFDENAANSVAVERENLLLKWYLSYQYPN